VNAAAIAAFLVWFGGSGLLLTRFIHWTTTLVSLLAALIGVTAAVLINALLSALARQESRAEPISMIGMIGRTTVTIRAGGTGEIVFAHAGTRRVAAARSDDGAAIPRAVEVVVLRYEKGSDDPALTAIDYGAIALRRSIVERLPEGASALDAVQHELAASRRLRAIVAARRFYEIGSPEGLEALERDLPRLRLG
jgi:hypothetical protein